MFPVFWPLLFLASRTPNQPTHFLSLDQKTPPDECLEHSAKGPGRHESHDKQSIEAGDPNATATGPSRHRVGPPCLPSSLEAISRCLLHNPLMTRPISHNRGGLDLPCCTLRCLSRPPLLGLCRSADRGLQLFPRFRALPIDVVSSAALALPSATLPVVVVMCLCPRPNHRRYQPAL